MRHPRNALGDCDIVLVAGRRFSVGRQQAVHHHRCETMADGTEARRFVIAMILVQADRNSRVHLDQRIDHPRQHDVVGIAAGST